MVNTDRERIVIYFEEPERWRGDLTLPVGFSEMDYDTQADIIQGIVNEYQLRTTTVDYWDYA